MRAHTHLLARSPIRPQPARAHSSPVVRRARGRLDRPGDRRRQLRASICPCAGNLCGELAHTVTRDTSAVARQEAILTSSGAYPAPIVDTVVKLGGGLLTTIGHFDAALLTIAAASRAARLLVVPGGGPFADAVRDVDRRLPLSDDAAHWM